MEIIKKNSGIVLFREGEAVLELGPPDKKHVRNAQIYVPEDSRNKGVGRTLANAALNWCVINGFVIRCSIGTGPMYIDGVKIDCDYDIARIISFTSSLGFRIITADGYTYAEFP